MRTSDIIKQLVTYLPKFTEKFSEQANVTADINGNVMTVDSPRHGLSVGQAVLAKGIEVKVEIDTVTPDGDLFIITIKSDHDLTRDPLIAIEYVDITGWTDIQINGHHELKDVANRRQFTIKLLNSSGDAEPKSYLIQPAGVSGFYNVATVIDRNNFTIELSATYPIPFSSVGVISHSFRITGAADIERFISGYTETMKDKYWLCVIVGDVDISKDRNVSDDSVSPIYPQYRDDVKLRQIEKLNVYAFVPSSFEKAGRQSRDEVEDVRVALYKSICGYEPPSEYAEDYISAIAPTGDGYFAYLSKVASYIHRFDYEVVLDLGIDDFFTPSDDVAFRDINMDITLAQGNETESINSQIDLDEKPL